MDTRTKILDMIDHMQNTGEKVNIHSVAEKCGVSHSLIYNRYPDIKERIKNIKATQKEKQKVANDQELIAILTSKYKTLQQKVKVQNQGQDVEAFKALLVHVQEVYSMYDSLLEDRNRLATKVASQSN